MFTKTQTWKGSWSLIATIGSLIAIVSFIYLYSFPLSPSSLAFFVLDKFKTHNPINGSTGGTNPQPVLNLDTRFPADSHKAVVYRGAPWKSEIGRWLSGCDSITGGQHC
ncbi:hypothetical protein MKW92_005633 [Papaver armeniacum]|nr:hypothetical protein MKW92_005633 [Papaver armeniacum]